MTLFNTNIFFERSLTITNSVPKSGKINVQIGSENKEVNITDSISSVLGNSQGLNLLEEKNTDAGDGNILSWTLARVIMVDESNGDTDISVAHTALNNYLQEHQELINDPTLFTIEDIVNRSVNHKVNQRKEQKIIDNCKIR